MERQFTGTVIRTTGSWYDVRTDAGETVKCRIRGRLRLKGVRSTNPVVVGDRVVCERDEEDAGVICEVVPRRNYIIRRASNLSKESHIIAANLDRALLVVTLFSPVTAPEFIDRFLVTCEAYRVPVTILLAKADLAAQDPEAVAAFKATYESAGYSVLEFSAFDGTGIEAVRELLRRELANVLKSLTPREERVLTLRFGLEDGQARTLEELGKEFNVTRERIRQIEAKALRKLRHPSRAKRLRDYLEE